MPRVYVGNLPYRVRERDIEDIFAKFGRIREVDLKTPHRGAPYAFLDFDDARDAEDAIDRRNGYDLDGSRIRVEMSRGGRGGRDRDGGRGRGPPRRSEFRVVVTGLPRSASWQDLKDHMRRGGEVGYANTFGDGSGVVEYGSYDDMRRAIRKLDDSEFENPFDRAVIRVREERGGGGGGRRRSRSRSPRRRRSRSPVRRRARSPVRRRSRSGSAAKEEPSRRSRSRSQASNKSAPRDDAKSADGDNKTGDDAPRDKSRSRSRSRSAARKSRSRSRSPSAAAAAKSRSRSPARKSRSRSRS